jgi:hypothetical protein
MSPRARRPRLAAHRRDRGVSGDGSTVAYDDTAGRHRCVAVGRTDTYLRRHRNPVGITNLGLSENGTVLSGCVGRRRQLCRRAGWQWSIRATATLSPSGITSHVRALVSAPAATGSPSPWMTPGRLGSSGTPRAGLADAPFAPSEPPAPSGSANGRLAGLTPGHGADPSGTATIQPAVVPTVVNLCAAAKLCR